MFRQTFYFNELYHGSGCHWPDSRRGPSVQITGQPMRDLRWKNGHWARFFSEYFGFTQLLWLHQCSILIRTNMLLLTGQRANPASLLKSNTCSENREALYRRNFHFCMSRILLVTPVKDLYFILYFDGYYIFKWSAHFRTTLHTLM